MTGPRSTATIKMDISHMKDGDHAGFAAFNGHSGVLDIVRTGKRYELSMSRQVVHLRDSDKAVTKVDIEEKARITLNQKTIWLRIEADFTNHQDCATFYYSTDGKTFRQLGSDFRMQFDYRRFFMGTRFAIFNYATKTLGGYIDVDYYHLK